MGKPRGRPKKIIAPVDTDTTADMTVTLKVRGATYRVQGKSLQEILPALKPKIPSLFRTFGVLAAEREGKRRVVVLSRMILQPLFGETNKLAKQFAVEQVIRMFKDI